MLRSARASTNAPSRAASIEIASSRARCGKNLRLAAMVPGGIFLAMQLMRLRAVRRSPVGLGWLVKRPLPDALVDGWLRPLQTQRGVRRDLASYARGARGAGRWSRCASG